MKRPESRYRFPNRPRPTQANMGLVAGRWRLLLAAGLILLPAGGRLHADSGESKDLVVLRLQRGGGHARLRGRVTDYNGRTLTIHTQGNAVRVYPAEQVIKVETPQTSSHLEGLQEFSAGRVEQARRKFQAALLDEDRDWVRREILAMLIRCALHRGDYAKAGTRFLALVESDLHTRHFKLIPLVWAPQPPQAGLRNQARSWLTEPGEIARLLGASALLRDGEYGQAAKDELQRLAAGADRRVYSLARAQLWRRRLTETDPTARTVDDWHARVLATPEELRGGPYYVLGRAHWKRREYDKAAMAFLWLPLVYDHDRSLAARACLEAADALARAGRAGEATRLYREVSSRFDETPFAQEASLILQNRSEDVSSKKAAPAGQDE